jgi:hypothetical protein
MFLSTMVPKAFAKWQQHPGLFDRERVAAARTIYAFDDAFTAPLHGFKGTDDYWQRASAAPHLARLRIPALVLNAGNDPFVPAHELPQAHQVGPMVTLWRVAATSAFRTAGFRAACSRCPARWPAGWPTTPESLRRRSKPWTTSSRPR